MTKQDKDIVRDLRGQEQPATKQAAQRTSPGIQPKGPPPDVEDKKHLPKKERALEEALEESMDGSDPPSITQPGKNFSGPNN